MKIEYHDKSIGVDKLDLNLLVYIIKRFFEDRVPPSGFYRAILANDLFSAVDKADDINVNLIPQIVRYIFNNVPMSCYGSYTKVDKWLSGGKK